MPGLSTLRVVGGGQEEEEEEEGGGDKKKGGDGGNKERTEREKVDGTDYGATHDQIGPAAHTRPERQEEEEAAVASVYSSLSLFAFIGRVSGAGVYYNNNEANM